MILNPGISSSKNNSIPLTTQAHQIITQCTNPGDITIDATVGNGHDTLFLANLLGKQGVVFGFDCQQLAIEVTQKKLENNNMSGNTQLFHASHSRMNELIPSRYHGKIQVIMFNLGYLPGSDKTHITQADTTLSALNQAIELISATGVITVIAYPGHLGGEIETDQINHWCTQLSIRHFNIQIIYSSDKPTAPRLFIIKKLRSTVSVSSSKPPKPKE